MSPSSNTPPTWSIRPWEEEDLDEILDLIYVGFGEPTLASKAFFDWGVNHCPAGPGSIIVATDNETGQLVGEIWMSMFHLQVSDRLFRCHDLYNLVVHPDYRLRGVFRSIIPVALQQAPQIGAQLGFASSRARHGHVAVDTGNHLIENLPLLIHILDAPSILHRLTEKLWSKKWNRRPPASLLHLETALAALAGRLLFPPVRQHSAPAGLLFEEPAGADQRFDRFWSRVRSKVPCMRVRDARHQNWRYHDCPGRIYSTLLLRDDSDIVAYMVIRNIADSGIPLTMIVDVLAEPGPRGREAVSWLTQQAILRARQQGQAAVATMLTTRSEELGAMRDSGMVLVPNQIRPGFLSLMVRIYDPSVPRSYYSAESWHFTIGDFDFF